MKWLATSECLKRRYYKIKYDPFVGFYLYVFEDDKCIHDHLQDTLEMAIECPWEDYGVPKNAWQRKFRNEN